MPGCRCCCCSGSINNYWQLSAGATATATSTGRITLPTLRRDATRRYRAAISAFFTFDKTKDLSNELWQLIKCERTVNYTSTQRTDHPTGHYALTHALPLPLLRWTPPPPRLVSPPANTHNAPGRDVVNVKLKNHSKFSSSSR